MKTLKTLLQVIGIGTVLAAAPMFAQSSVRVRMEIPYTFQAGNLQMPPGEYVIKADSNSAALWFCNLDTRQSLVMTAGIPLLAGSPDKAQATFHVYAGKYYLASIWNPNNEAGRVLNPSRSEKEAAASGVALQVKVLQFKAK